MTPSRRETAVASSLRLAVMRLARRLRGERSDTSLTISSLEAAGLVTRTDHPRDGRQVLLAASPGGTALVREDRRRRDAWLAQRLRDLPPDELEVLRRAAVVLERLAAT